MMIVVQKHEQKKHYYSEYRKNMVENQLPCDVIWHPGVREAFLTVRREEYVFPKEKSICYSGDLIPLKQNRFMLPPLTLAQMVQHVVCGENIKNVLVIGPTLGYSLEILKRLGCHVYGVDHDFFIEQACVMHPSLKNIYQISSLVAGWQEKAPFDAILIEGAMYTIPTFFLSQLRENGILAFLHDDHALCYGKILQKKNNIFQTLSTFQAIGYTLPDFEKENSFKF